MCGKPPKREVVCYSETCAFSLVSVWPEPQSHGYRNVAVDRGLPQKNDLPSEHLTPRCGKDLGKNCGSLIARQVAQN